MNTDRPEIDVMPPLAVLVAILVTAALGYWVPFNSASPALRMLGMALGGLIIMVGFVVGGSGFLAFRRAGTNIVPTQPALSVVRGGIFRYTRNPMYLSMVMLVGGLGLIFSNPWGPITAVGLWAVLHWAAVLPEERYLETKFGDAYRALKAETRRWI